MKMKVPFVVVLALLLSFGVGAVYGSMQADHGEFEGFPIVQVEVDGEVIESDIPAVNLEGRTMVPLRFVSEALGAYVDWDHERYTAIVSTDTDKAIDPDNPYYEAEEVEPIQNRNVALDEDFSSVLVNVFDEDPKIVSTGDITALEYIVDRVITSDDVKEIEALLDEKGYETVGSDIDAQEYTLDISIDEDIVEEKYDGDPGGNMYVSIYTAEEGENAQKIVITFL